MNQSLILFRQLRIELDLTNRIHELQGILPRRNKLLEEFQGILALSNHYNLPRNYKRRRFDFILSEENCENHEGNEHLENQNGEEEYEGNYEEDYEEDYGEEENLDTNNQAKQTRIQELESQIDQANQAIESISAMCNNLCSYLTLEYALTPN